MDFKLNNFIYILKSVKKYRMCHIDFIKVLIFLISDQL